MIFEDVIKLLKDGKQVKVICELGVIILRSGK